MSAVLLPAIKGLPMRPEDVDEVLAIDQALGALAVRDSRAAQVVEMRYFVGLDMDEIAKGLGLPKHLKLGKGMQGADQPSSLAAAAFGYLLFGLNNLFRSLLRLCVGNGLFPLFLIILILFARFGCIFCFLVGLLSNGRLLVSSRLFVSGLRRGSFFGLSSLFLSVDRSVRKNEDGQKGKYRSDAELIGEH